MTVRRSNDPSTLRNMVAGTPPGKKVAINILRNGKEQKVQVTVAELPAEMQKLQGKFDNILKGVMVQGLTPEMKKNLDIPKRITGVVVTDIEDGSPAEGVLMANDVIAEVNRKKITGMKDYEAVVSQIKADHDILLLVFRNGSAIYITLTSK